MTQDAHGPVLTRTSTTAEASSSIRHAEPTTAAPNMADVTEVPVKQPERLLQRSAPAPAAVESHGSNGAVLASQLADALQAVQIKTASNASSLPDEAGPTAAAEASGSNNHIAPASAVPPQPSAVAEIASVPVADAAAGADSDAPLDPALLGALRNGRDRPFVLRHELEMAAFVRDSRRASWELPLMNSYQRLLVHRLADQFMLVHSIEPSTKAVHLSKQASSFVPTHLPSMRTGAPLSADAPPLSLAVDASPTSPLSVAPSSAGLGGSCTNTAAGTVTGSAPGTATLAKSSPAFKIMRRDPSASTTRSHSPHLSGQGGDVADDSSLPCPSGSTNGETGTPSRRDRKNMTIEEREAAYREARERIFQGFSGAPSDPAAVAGLAGAVVGGAASGSPIAATGVENKVPAKSPLQEQSQIQMQKGKGREEHDGLVAPSSSSVATPQRSWAAAAAASNHHYHHQQQQMAPPENEAEIFNRHTLVPQHQPHPVQQQQQPPPPPPGAYGWQPGPQPPHHSADLHHQMQMQMQMQMHQQQQQQQQMKAFLRPSAPAFDPSARSAGGWRPPPSAGPGMMPMPYLASASSPPALGSNGARQPQQHAYSPETMAMMALPQVQVPQGMYQAGVVQGVPVFAISPQGYSQQPSYPGSASSSGSTHGNGPYGRPPAPPHDAWQPQLHGHDGPHSAYHGGNTYSAGLPPPMHHAYQPMPNATTYTPSDGRGRRHGGITGGRLSAHGGSSDGSRHGTSRSSSSASGLELALGGGNATKKSPNHDSSSVVSSSSASSRSSKVGSIVSTTSHPLPARPDWAMRPAMQSRRSFGSSTSSIAPSASVSVNGRAGEGDGVRSGASAFVSALEDDDGVRSNGTASPSLRSVGTASPTSASRSVSVAASIGIASEPPTTPSHESPTSSKAGDPVAPDAIA